MSFYDLNKNSGLLLHVNLNHQSVQNICYGTKCPILTGDDELMTIYIAILVSNQNQDFQCILKTYERKLIS